MINECTTHEQNDRVYVIRARIAHTVKSYYIRFNTVEFAEFVNVRNSKRFHSESQCVKYVSFCVQYKKKKKSSDALGI